MTDFPITVEQAAAILDTSEGYVRGLVLSGEIRLTDASVRAHKQADDDVRRAYGEITRHGQEGEPR